MVEDEAGKVAFFGAELEFDLKEIDDESVTDVTITVWDKDNFNLDDKVGETVVTIEELLKTTGETSHKIFHNEQRCGEVFIWSFK